jgi:hypothetical protein
VILTSAVIAIGVVVLTVVNNRIAAEQRQRAVNWTSFPDRG